MKRVMVRTGITRSNRTATIHRVLRKTGLKWIHAEKKGELNKSDFKVRIGVFLEGPHWCFPGGSVGNC